MTIELRDRKHFMNLLARSHEAITYTQSFKPLIDRVTEASGTADVTLSTIGSFRHWQHGGDDFGSCTESTAFSER